MIYCTYKLLFLSLSQTSVWFTAAVTNSRAGHKSMPSDNEFGRIHRCKDALGRCAGSAPDAVKNKPLRRAKTRGRSLIMQMKPALLVTRSEQRGRDPFLHRRAFIFSLRSAAFDLHTLIRSLEQTVKDRQNPSGGYAMIM